MKKLILMAAAAALVFTSCDDPNKNDGPAGGAGDYSKLKFNEFYGAGEDNEKYVELYNIGDVELSLEGVMIEKDGGDLSWEGKAGDKIAAKSVYLILGAKKTTPNGLQTGFSAKKNVLMELSDPTGKIIDTFQRGDEPAADAVWGDVTLPTNSGSWSRIPDGTGAWKMTATMTPGEKNATEGTDDPDLK